ncbi:hypothetical protein [Aeromicrobium sp. UC242_57]|uniref:hypothetical protein n=1 Tax=Aeromicrobium sp. UC242_57 TaxID=3374624 RepID=UPI00379B01F2
MSSSAPKRRLDVRQESPQRVAGKRAAERRAPRRHSLVPTPAMAGACALLLAAFGSTVIGSAADGNTLKADNYQTISQRHRPGRECERRCRHQPRLQPQQLRQAGQGAGQPGAGRSERARQHRQRGQQEGDPGQAS